MAEMGLPGFKIPMWERHPDGTMIKGEEYPRISVTTYATHDHAPMRLQWEEWQREVGSSNTAEAEGAWKILGELLAFSGRTDLTPGAPFEGEVHEALWNALLKSNSWIVIPMITDLFGTTQRFNVPGAIGSGNWTARIDEPVSAWNTRHTDLLARWRVALRNTGRS
jgi:4-alpha-glucanotransferase